MTSFNNSGKDTAENHSNLTGLSKIGTGKWYIEGEMLLLTLLTFSTKKERKISQSSFEEIGTAAETGATISLIVSNKTLGFERLGLKNKQPLHHELKC